jgi:hypothetical protein
MSRERSMALLFAAGSACFLVGPFPGYAQLVGATAVAVTFFVGSILFTGGGAVQSWLAFPDRGSAGAGRAAWWAAIIQSAGTLFFNVTTFHALSTLPDDAGYDRLVWRPDAFGSICFLVASGLAWYAVRGARDRGWWIAVINLAGSIAFGVSAVAGYIVPATGDYLDLAAANVSTVVGALCFLAGALLLLVDGARARNAPRLRTLEAA